MLVFDFTQRDQKQNLKQKELEEQRQKMVEMEWNIYQLQHEVGILRKNKKLDNKTIKSANTILYKNQKKISGLSLKSSDAEYFVNDKDLEKNYSQIYDIEVNAFKFGKKFK